MASSPRTGSPGRLGLTDGTLSSVRGSSAIEPAVMMAAITKPAGKPFVSPFIGRLDDAAWAAAPWTGDFVDIEGDRRPRRRTVLGDGASGDVDVILQGRLRSDVILARLTPGNFFGEIELLRGGKSIANVHAASNAPVELMALPRADFLRVIHESPITADALGNIVQQRLEEHRAVDRRKVRRLMKR